MSKITLVIVGDLHINSTVALCPPLFELDDGGQYMYSKAQKFIWDTWKGFWNRAEETAEKEQSELWGFFNGELVDDLNHRSTQLITKNPADMLRLSAEALKPALGILDRVFVMRGTEAHSGVSACYDEVVARDIEAEESFNNTHSWWTFIGEIAGTKIHVQHHSITSYSRTHTKGSAGWRQAYEIWSRYALANEEPPKLAIFGHTHRPSDSYDELPTRAITLPSWQLSNAFAHRIAASPQPIGGGIFVLDGGEVCKVDKAYTNWPIKTWTPGKARWKDSRTTN